MAEIGALLLEQFQSWGMPQAIRSDNGSPLGVPSRSVIPIISLWLAAWGVRHILNRPRRPTDNPNVENNQYTSARWAEVYKCQGHVEMQEQLDQACVYQRDFFKVSRLGKVTRKQLYARLYNNPRQFDPKLFDEQKAYQLLAQAVYPRKISDNGVITIYDKPFSVGCEHRGKITFVTFSPAELAWICLDSNKEILKVLTDARFSKENIYNLTVCQ